MNPLQALCLVKRLNSPVFTSNDVKTLLNVSSAHASMILNTLREAKEIIKLTHGLWGIPNKINRFTLPSYLCAPFPVYLSLQTALQIHGVIEQIPEVVYAISTRKTKRFTTDIATISIHHIHPDFFFGYITQESFYTIATPEKALIDFFYLKTAKTRLFNKLPELDVSELNFTQINAIIEKIPDSKRRTMVEKELNSVTANRF